MVLGAGFFDGVHRGHCRVIRAAMADARKIGGCAWALTFDPHPMKVLHPEGAPSLLTSHQHKLRLIAKLGVAGCVVLRFTRRMARMEPEAFVNELVRSMPPVRGIVVGDNWRFGRQGRGDPVLLQKLCAGHGLRVRVVKPVLQGKSVISSTRIRKAIAAGDLSGAAGMLGRPFSIFGTVVRGSGIGRKLGFPTANLDPHNEVVPPMGVYAAEAVFGDRRLEGVVNIGLRPTICHGRHVLPLVELHVFDFHERLYGKDIEVFFLKYLRPERKFDSEEDLKSQIARDIAIARKILADR